LNILKSGVDKTSEEIVLKFANLCKDTIYTECRLKGWQAYKLPVALNKPLKKHEK
jgi:hypothetical protein